VDYEPKLLSIGKLRVQQSMSLIFGLFRLFAALKAGMRDGPRRVQNIGQLYPV
jgi:hypothetical protein